MSYSFGEKTHLPENVRVFHHLISIGQAVICPKCHLMLDIFHALTALISLSLPAQETCFIVAEFPESVFELLQSAMRLN